MQEHCDIASGAKHPRTKSSIHVSKSKSKITLSLLQCHKNDMNCKPYFTMSCCRFFRGSQKVNI